MLRVATWNVNSVRARLEHLQRFVELAKPDVLCLQELKCSEGQYPEELLNQAGLSHHIVWGQKSYNGVSIASRFPIDDPASGFTVGEPDEQARLVRGTIEGMRIVCAYVPNGSAVGSDKYRYKLRWLKQLQQDLATEVGAHKQFILCGDINIAPDDGDVHDPFMDEDQILVSAAERSALQRITELGLVDAYRARHSFGSAFTWWDYRGGGFPRNRGFRIDLMLISQAALQMCEADQVWREVRGWEKPSDHAPVTFDFERQPAELQ